MQDAATIAPLAINAFLLTSAAALGIYLLCRSARPLALTVLLAILMSAGFAFLINDKGLPWWGLQGDEAFVGAAITKAWHGLYFSDFYYPHLPPFYPPLYFWTTGTLGRLLGLAPIAAMNAGVAASLLLLPLVIYTGIRLLPKHLFPSGAQFRSWFAFFAACAVVIVSEWVGFLSKPYEFLAAALAILWTLHMVAVLQKKNNGKARVLLLGITGALLVWLYYFWMLFAALALLLAGIRFAPRNRARWYGKLCIITAVCAILAAPFIYALLQASLQVGSEAWQAQWFTPADLIPFPTLLHGLPAIVALLGIYAFAVHRKKTIPFVLGCVTLATLLWFAANLLAFSALGRTALPNKAMYFLGAYAFGFAAAWAITVRTRKKIRTGKPRAAAGIAAVVWIAAITATPGGLFAFEFGNDHIASLAQDRETQETVVFLNSISNLPSKIALVSEQPLLVGQTPLSVFLSFNMHFTHPAARWSERYLVLHRMATAQSAAEFTSLARGNPFSPIDLLVLTKQKNSYALYLWRDNFPRGGYDQTVSIAGALISPDNWKTLFENNRFVIFGFSDETTARTE